MQIIVDGAVDVPVVTAKLRQLGLDQIQVSSDDKGALITGTPTVALARWAVADDTESVESFTAALVQAGLPDTVEVLG